MRWISSRKFQFFQSADIRLTHLSIGIQRKNESNVDVDAVTDEVSDSRYSSRSSRNLYHHIRALQSCVESLCFRDSALSIVREERADFYGSKSIRTCGTFIYGEKKVCSIAYILNGKTLENLRCAVASKRKVK